jgi:serine/threonine-protein kinase
VKNNGDIVAFVKQKDYVMVNNDLGSGSFGQTVLLKDPFIDELFVAKKYEPYYESDRKEFFDSFLQEIKIMYKLNHKNVVRVFSYYPFESLYTGYILMEYIDGKRIDEYLDDPSLWAKGVDPDTIFSQLIDGFAYIEERGIVHRDIREGNILITREGVVKIIDFGLGKTFSPIDTSDDSMAEIINRSGLDRLPNEYFEGKYDSQTDMFYLAELYNRLLRETHVDFLFSYDFVLHKMMELKKENRYVSFAEIKEAMAKKDFGNLEISQKDKEIYQEFSNAIMTCLSCFKESRTFVTDIKEFKDNIHAVIQRNCFENIVQNPNDLVSIVAKGNYKFYTQREISCEVVTAFEKWYNSLSEDWQRLVLNNIIAKLSVVKIEYADDELPF